ncbi:MAG TPA: hypothetical protein VMU66_06870 [Gaiellales bacterium]|nr:hypothetical protein [Gaiellales bacterium]
MTPTLRRLNDRERYWGLSWPTWIAVAVAGALLYGAVRVSPLGTRATITIVVLVLAFAGMVLASVSGQALSPGRQLLAIIRYRRWPKRYRLPTTPDRRGLVLDTIPDPDTDLDTLGEGSVCEL